MAEERTVACGAQAIRYALERKPVKNLNLRIRKDGSVYVSAAPSIQAENVDGFVASKEKYILRARETFLRMAAYAPRPKAYISGESFLILGRDLRLKVEQAPREKVFSDGVYIFLQLKDPKDIRARRRLVDRFLDGQCREIFGKAISSTFPVFQKYGVPFPELRIRDMETRWGSCLAAKAVITLNKRLLEVPLNCIEYVVMHEFCHFLHPDHSKRFYATLTMLMPDWKERKDILEKCAGFGL